MFLGFPGLNDFLKFNSLVMIFLYYKWISLISLMWSKDELIIFDQAIYYMESSKIKQTYWRANYWKRKMTAVYS